MKRQDQVKPADAVEEVRRFYDQHPYPPPIKDLKKYGKLGQDRARRRADYHLYWPGRPYRENLSILIAGCGTSQAAKHALRYPGARVVGIDVSRTSIQHTETLKREYNLANLEVHQLPVERCQALGQQFDKIVCTGVLHHLPDPDAGLHALRGVLEPDGAMHLMVYATYGRTGVYMLQEYCRRLGIGRSDEEILDLANTLMALPPEHPLAPLLREAHDFKTKAGLADALLHPQDRAYTVPQLFSFIKRAGLTFGRWVRQASYLPQCGALAQSPHGLRLRQLSPEAQYAAVELFRGTMVRHNAVVYHGDQARRTQTIRFDNETWMKYVPIRLPQTRCIEDRLPPGAAAVLLNQGHTDSDLILPIDELQKRLFEAIDGQKNLLEIMDGVTTMGDDLANRELVRTIFERLWWYDQVVFDASV